MASYGILIQIICLASVIVNLESPVSAMGMYRYLPGFPTESRRYECRHLSSTETLKLPLDTYTPTITKMVHITCDFCQTYGFSCKDRICQQAWSTTTPLRSSVLRDLAHALCQLCDPHQYYECKVKFCPENENNPVSAFVQKTCDVCLANGEPCANAKQVTNIGIGTFLGILDGPLWDFVLADDMFTSNLIGEVQIGEWDDFLSRLSFPLLENDYTTANDYMYYYDDGFYDVKADDIIYDDREDYMDD